MKRLKRLSHPEQDAQLRARFLRGARLQLALHHEALLGACDLISDEGQLALVMPYCEGGNLRMRLRNGPLPWREALSLGRHLLGGLQLLHTRGIVHRDIKPENLLFLSTSDPLSAVRLGDFGIARSIETQASLTVPMTELGSLAYLSPSRAEGCDATPADDLYSLSLVLYESILGSFPFRQQGDFGHFQRLYERAALPPLESFGHPRALSLFFERALSTQSCDRPPTLQSYAWALDQLISTPSLLHPEFWTDKCYDQWSPER
ncbi:MAG: serine/threonine-protein kinase [Myxococcota bacterium]|nr:serine/threonine-protein kinase [Myxococcota bacterium]